MSHPKVLLQIKRRNFSVFLASTLQCKSNQRTWSFIIQTNCWGFFLNKLRKIDFVALIIYIIHTLPFVFSSSVYPHNIASVQTITKLWVNQSLISSAHRLPQYGFRIQLNCGSWGWKLIAVHWNYYSKKLGSLLIDLFTDTEAILNLLDLRSIMGCPEGTRLVFTRAFRAKKRTSLYISREKGDHYYIQTRHNDLFSHYNLFLGKLGPKRAHKYWASISDRARVPWSIG